MHRQRGMDGLLAAVVAGGDVSASLATVLASPQRSHQLLRAAENHRVVGHLYRALLGMPDLPPTIWDHVESDARGQVAHHMRCLADLRAFGEVMAAADLPWLVVKGPVMAERFYPQPELRTYGDLDVVVPGEVFGDAVRALEHEGLAVIDRNWRLLAREGRAQLHLVLRFGTLADLHWHVLNQRSLRRGFTIPMEELFVRRQLVEVGGLWTPTLDAIDTVLHLCVHAALSGGNRLSWLSDITRAVPVGASWESLVDRAGQWSARTATYTMLRRARDTLGALVPDEVLRALAPGPVRTRVTAAMDHHWPLDAHTRSLQAVWTEIARDTAWAEASAAVRRLGRPLLWRARAALDGHSIKSAGRIDVLENSGGAIGRSHYLAEVAGAVNGDDRAEFGPATPKRANGM